MKKYILILALLGLSVSSYTQVLIDNGPLTDPNIILPQYSLSTAKWHKFSFTYYINNNSTHLTASQRSSIISAAFQTWAAAACFTFTEVSSPTNADFKLSWHVGNHGDGSDNAFDGVGGVLAHAYYPPPLGGSYAGQIHFDDAENWTADLSGISLLSVAIHEIGHALGLEHSSVSTAIMYRYYNGGTTLTQDDINGIQALYYPPSSGTSFNFSNYQSGNLLSPCPNEYVDIFPQLPYPASQISQYEWQVTNCTLISSGKESASVRFPSGIYADFTIKYRYKNGCYDTWSTWATITGRTRNCAAGEDPYSPAPSGGSSGNYSASPNPVNDVLTVSLGLFSSSDSSYNIKLYNANGVAVRQATSQGENVYLNVSALPNGYYYLHIFNGNDPQPNMRTIIVQH
jgi:hypothetical protein